MFEKLLVANRGEIAVRVFRTARSMGIRTVAIASEVDRSSVHAKEADELIVGGDTNCYLDINWILQVAKQTGADSIHPGYGFLSERDEFSEACREAGIAFVGPSPEAMRCLGSKIDAKTLAVQSGVPIVPGFFQSGADVDQLRVEADQIGYPVLLKASAGGGGRGMRVVSEASDFADEFALASEEAVKAFGDGAMMVEKLIQRPRHVEVQVLADEHGTVACLFERECSIQRRHQKLIEESPSPGLLRMQGLWERIAEASRKLILAAGYVGAGTVEFILDESSGAFYFLEVNARLQVEHPVTESVTGLDLVAWQLRIAAGMPLDLSTQLLMGDRTALRGHAIEARIVAEDPGNGFLPSVGKILQWAEPRQLGIRIDAGFAAGQEVSRFYDSLLAKVIATGETRDEAINRLREALLEFHILGVKTNIGFLLDVLDSPGFRRGDFDTGFLGRVFSEWERPTPPVELGAILLSARGPSGGDSFDISKQPGAWGLMDAFRVTASV